MSLLCRRWLPQQAIDEYTIGEAMWLEKEYWKRMEVAVTNGIAKAFKGR